MPLISPLMPVVPHIERTVKYRYIIVCGLTASNTVHISRQKAHNKTIKYCALFAVLRRTRVTYAVL